MGKGGESLRNGVRNVNVLEAIYRKIINIGYIYT